MQVRPARDGDREAINALLRAEGFRERSAAGWRWLFQDNPARLPGSPPGWLVEDPQGGIRGYVGNIPLRYALGGREIRAATCTAYCVQEPARSQSIPLLQAWLRQRGVDLFLSTTANAQSEPVYRLFKAQPPAEDCFRDAWVWLASSRAVLRAGADRLGLPGALAAPLAGLGAPLLGAARRLAGLATPPRPRSAVTIEPLPISAIDGDFDAIWAEVRAGEPGGLRVWRDAETLRWILSDPDLRRPPLCLAARQGGRLAGYALAGLHHSGAVPIPQLRLLDLVVRPGPGALRDVGGALVHALTREAARAGAGIVYCSPVGPELAGLLGSLRPYRHRRDHHAHFLRATRQSGLPDLATPGLWQATPLDGDTPFVLDDQPQHRSA